MRFILASLLLSAISAHGAITYQFSVSGTNRATNFANHSSVATDGMRYGIVFDTTGNGFGGFTGNGTAPSSSSAGIYDVFSNTSSGFLSQNNIASDDYYWVPGNTTPQTATLTAAGSDAGGAGGITTATLMPVASDSGLPLGFSSGDKFAIIWFESSPTDGSYYGLFTDSSFTMPASGTTPVAFNNPFLANGDPIKAANLQFVAVPEPSRIMLLFFALFGFTIRRRRSI